MADIKLFKEFNFFSFRDIEEIMPEFIYRYLFLGMNLRDIEEEYYGSREYKGWLLKGLLNYYGIDTCGENRGIYSERDVNEVVETMSKSGNGVYIRVAKLLQNKYIYK